ncbi:hypothetical protein XHV734_4678 [Xanthomonas hortorum pv. vitians]|nr:hypothetical protein XHV734_4678 [Xanthomonas hortorum pv. vitians]
MVMLRKLTRAVMATPGGAMGRVRAVRHGDCDCDCIEAARRDAMTVALQGSAAPCNERRECRAKRSIAPGGDARAFYFCNER